MRGSFSCRAQNHTMRTMPPSVSRIYCEVHDEGIWNSAKALMGIQDASDPEHQQLASLPIRDRTPQIAQLVVTSKVSGGVQVGPHCGKARGLTQVKHGIPASGNAAGSIGSSVSDSSFRKTTMLTNRLASRRAHLRSHSAAMPALRFPTVPRLMSSRFPRTCSG